MPGRFRCAGNYVGALFYYLLVELLRRLHYVIQPYCVCIEHDHIN